MDPSFDLPKFWLQVTVSYSEYPEDLDLMVLWCEENCLGRWAYGLQHSDKDASIEYAFYFRERVDHTAFNLIWGIT